MDCPAPAPTSEAPRCAAAGRHRSRSLGDARATPANQRITVPVGIRGGWQDRMLGREGAVERIATESAVLREPHSLPSRLDQILVTDNQVSRGYESARRKSHRSDVIRAVTRRSPGARHATLGNRTVASRLGNRCYLSHAFPYRFVPSGGLVLPPSCIQAGHVPAITSTTAACRPAVRDTWRG